MNKDTTEAKLQEPFEPNDIKWRVQQSGVSNGRVWMKVLPYITGRAIQKRLDDVFGVFGWEVLQEPILGARHNLNIPYDKSLNSKAMREVIKEAGKPTSLDGFICTVSFYDEKKDRWIKKQDVAQLTDIEPLKGGSSGALKRAGALLGIGRYLYQLEAGFAKCVPCQNHKEAVYNFAKVKDKYNGGTEYGVDWEPPQLPDWALPGLDTSKFTKAILDAKNVHEINKAYEEAYFWANSFSRNDLVETFKQNKADVIEKLDTEAQNLVAKRLDEVNKWLDGAIKNINAVPDAGTVHKIGETVRSDLARKCEGQYFDMKPLVIKLRQAISNRVNAIEGK